MKNKLLVNVVVLVIAASIAWYFYNKYRVAPKIKFETIELEDLSGKQVSLDSFHNKKLFINFFATWCGPCIREIPSLVAAQEILTNENFQFILISDESVEKLKNIQEHVSLPVYHSVKKLRDLNIATFPSSYLLNTKHEIVYKQTNEADWSSEAMIEKLKRLSE